LEVAEWKIAFEKVPNINKLDENILFIFYSFFRQAALSSG